MTVKEICDFIGHHDLAVLSTVAPGAAPESALVGIAVSSELEIIFDTLTTTRKYRNLIANPLTSFVIGWENETTLQYEGIAEELRGPMPHHNNQDFREIYFAKWPSGRDRLRWPNITHFVVLPKWIRYSDFNPGGTTFELSL